MGGGAGGGHAPSSNRLARLKSTSGEAFFPLSTKVLVFGGCRVLDLASNAHAWLFLLKSFVRTVLCRWFLRVSGRSLSCCWSFRGEAVSLASMDSIIRYIAASGA
jgi:hypothetical protein